MRARCNLAQHRGERTIADMAKAAMIARPYLSQIEAGIRLPSDEEAKRIARAYGITVEQMYDWRPMEVVGLVLDGDA